jgi:formylglycine-generating enzyme
VVTLSVSSRAVASRAHGNSPAQNSARAVGDTEAPGASEMFFLPGGVFAMGSERFYPEEGPIRRVRVDSFWIDRAPVTNAEFARFVEETGYRTIAEIAPDPNVYRGSDGEPVEAGSLLFQPPADEADATDFHSWWSFVEGVDWRHPAGPASSIEGLEEHPVVHVAWLDAKAYANWAGKALPTEAEWEYAARGGIDGAEFAWGDELAPDGRMLANYWQGAFPTENRMLDGWERTSPVGFYPDNGFGLVDMIGNVWEWTNDWYAQPRIERKTRGACCIPSNPRGATKAESYDSEIAAKLGRKVVKGGSHLCADNYCQRYRPAARQPQTIDTSTSHIGFRCVSRRPSPPSAGNHARPAGGAG